MSIDALDGRGAVWIDAVCRLMIVRLRAGDSVTNVARSLMVAADVADVLDVAS